MKNLLRFIGIYVAFLLQSLLFQEIRIFSSSPDIMLALLVIFSVSLDIIPAAFLGAFAGLLMDVMYERVFGINLLIYMFLALFVSLATDRKNENSPLIMSWISFVSVAAFEIAAALLKSVVSQPLKISVLCANIFVKGIFGAIFALVFVISVQKIRRKSDKKSNSREEAEV